MSVKKSKFWLTRETTGIYRLWSYKTKRREKEMKCPNCGSKECQQVAEWLDIDNSKIVGAEAEIINRRRYDCLKCSTMIVVPESKIYVLKKGKKK